jgi:type II secretory pathway pseudopilin PulG
MFSRKGFTLIEAVVAMLIGAFVVIAVGGLSERLIHHRATTDSNSAAMSLAVRQMEKLLADSNKTPTGCPAPGSLTTSSPALCAGTHPAVTANADGTGSGPYQVQWTVVNADASATSPLVIPTPDPSGALQDPVKQITVTVTMPHNPLVNAQIVRFKYNLGV